ncbi:receptor-type tyrosine-protein phosphatase alpha-like isoform X2 [Antedon mediterranea]|uniref:receptor-type tyrosine-protein phosphatase alpha-like isoform X2 n=1 Tax=Antedon mediterranea TaxID=105859 RepID=UPI003AF733D2
MRRTMETQCLVAMFLLYIGTAAAQTTAGTADLITIVEDSTFNSTLTTQTTERETTTDGVTTNPPTTKLQTTPEVTTLDPTTVEVTTLDPTTVALTTMDGQAPNFTCPPNIMNATDAGSAKALVSYTTPTATDNVDGPVTVTCMPLSGDMFAVGTTVVNCTAQDDAGNSNFCTFEVTIADDENPVLNCPGNKSLPTDEGKAYSTYVPQVNATDNVDGTLNANCSFPENFPLGPTIVNCTAEDGSMNEVKCNFTVTVSDDEKPILDCKDDTENVLLDGDNTAVAYYTLPTATDNVGVVSVPNCIPPSGSEFNEGDNPIKCTATDEAGNNGTCTFTLTVIDCEVGTFGRNCGSCACVNNTVCVPSDGSCPSCKEKEQYGFDCNYMDLSATINATNLNVTNNVVTQLINKDIHLRCYYNLLNISGTWVKDGEVVKNFTGSTSKFDMYNITNVTFDDLGRYNCTLYPLEYVDVDGVEPDTEYVDVNVEVSPNIILSPKSQEAELGENLTFYCSASGTPEVEITWIDPNEMQISKEEGKYNITSQIEINNNIFTTNSSLVVYNIAREDSGDYLCTAMNDLVNTMPEPEESSFAITVFEKPDSVDDLQTTPEERQITVSWTRGNNNNRPIINCTVGYMLSEDNFTSELAENYESHTIKNLQPDTEYTIRVFCTNDIGASDSKYEETKTKEDGDNTPLVAVIVVIVLLIVIVIILAGFLMRHRRVEIGNIFRRPSNRPPQEQFSLENDGYIQEYPAIAIDRLGETFEEKHRDNDKLFNQEYKSLPASSRPITTEASSIPENKGKNRYINILAYDHSRVILTEIEGEPGSDYINACYVDGYDFSNKFIAAQGPKEETVVDFWRMIWEQRSPAIVMLTKTFEKGREKCAQYWPDADSQEFEQFTITLEDTVKTCEYVIRKFRVQNSDYDEEARSIHQYHFIGWPDFGIPDYTYTMLSFIKRIRQMVPKPTMNGDVGPLTVHCSAGVGRTGTYIVIDSMLDQMAAEKQVDIYKFVSKIRGQRNLLVQSQVQYVFIHKALMEEYQYKESEIDVTSMQKKWSDLVIKQSDSDFTNLELEFRRVTQIPNTHLTQKDGTLEPNKAKNRLLQVIPYDINRVKLQRLIGKEHSDYINASYIDGYEYKAMYIATQAPTKETTGDFWRMVWDERTACIIMMTDLEENGREKCFQYWPEDNTPVVHDTIAVQVKEEREIEGSEYIIREFQVTNTKVDIALGGESRSVFQYHYVGWPPSSVPNSGTGLVDLIGKVHKYQESIHSTFPIVVHCSGGAGRTGVFIALSIMLERVKAEGLIDVFQTVRTLRQQRPHMVQNFEQYGFCYHAVREYMDSFDHYANYK